MPLDLRPMPFLRAALDAELVRWNPLAEILEVPPTALTHYAHDLTFGGDAHDVLATGETPDLRATGWVVRAPDKGGAVRARRHYLVADVEVGYSVASGWFPALLSMVAKLRSHLGPDEQADITMLLVAQPGANAAGRVAVLERNEAFAQVLVWTPGVDARKWPSEADQFVARLRLGPIEAPLGVTGGDLSPVDAIFEGTKANIEIRASWRGTLMNTGIKEVERARLLLAAFDAQLGAIDGK